MLLFSSLATLKVAWLLPVAASYYLKTFLSKCF